MKSTLLDIPVFALGFLSSVSSHAGLIQSETDLLDLPIPRTCTLKADVSMRNSTSKNLKWVMFQDGKILKSASRMNQKLNRCVFSASLAGTKKIPAGDYVLFETVFLKAGNGKINMEFRMAQKEPGDSQDPVFSITCEASDPNHDLTVGDLNQILGNYFELKEAQVTPTPTAAPSVTPVPRLLQLPEGSVDSSGTM